MTLLSLILIWVGYVTWLTVHNINLIKSGQNPLTKIRNRQFQASLSSAFANKQSTPEDLKRLMPRGGEPTLGNPQAKVRLIEFVDYDCPFSQQVAPTLINFMRRHADEVYLTLRDFPLTDIHPAAEQVAVAANCVWQQGDPKRFWDFYALFFVNQSDHSAGAMRLYAKQIGVGLAAFDICVTTQQPLLAIRQSFEDGVAAGVFGTPTFFFNGVKFQGALDAESLETIFELAKRDENKL